MFFPVIKRRFSPPQTQCCVGANEGSNRTNEGSISTNGGSRSTNEGSINTNESNRKTIN